MVAFWMRMEEGRMPWVHVDNCTGCGICVEECPVDAIAMVNELAEINMAECIRCGRCHDLCPEHAVGHDKELIPEHIRENVERARSAMDACARYFGAPEEGQKCLGRWLKYYTMQKEIMTATIKELESLQ
jgi:formate hydrogenlyase subunit 6/NADH:ubiquinone oxidoreductase subunit I